jgi:uncharacterized protein (TIGR01777 family)
MRIVILGASGFIGRRLASALRARGDEVIEASLRDPDQAFPLCESADAVVNLAGAPVAQRWTAEHKEAIRSSRVDAPRALIEGFARLPIPPKAYISASAIGYYGSSETAVFTEASPPGDDFLAGVCVQWEAQAHKAAATCKRVGIVRTGIVLGADGGALAKLLPIFKLGGGGVVASGRQWQSWIHIDDIVGIYLMMIDGRDGVVDGTAPNPVRQAEFTAALAKAVSRPAILPVPEFALKLLFGEGATVLTQGQRVLPERTQSLGYRFNYETIGPALTSIVA